MLLSRNLLRRLAWLLAGCLLFAQTAALAYACAWEPVVPVNEHAVATCSEHRSGAGPDAADRRVASGNACEVHCLTAALPDLDAGDVPAMAAVAVWDVQPYVVPRARPLRATELEAKSAAPPPRTRFARLLI